MAEKSAATGPIFVIAILLVAGIALGLELSVPTSPAYSLPGIPAHPAHYVNVTLYADANGWNSNQKGLPVQSGLKVNPTIVVLPGTVVNFTVIEEDNQPHTLTIAQGSSISSTSDTLLSTSDITTTTGHVSFAQAYFDTLGEYTYWCVVHPQTMIGHLWVNNSLPTFSLPTPPANMSANANQTLYADSNGWNYSHGTVNPVLYFRLGTLVNFTIIQEDGNQHGFYIAPGSNESSYNEVLLKPSSLSTKVGATSNFTAYFNVTGEYTYWDPNYANATEGHIFVVSGINSIILTVTSNGLDLNGNLNSSILVKNGSLLRIGINDSAKISYDVLLAKGYSPSKTNVTIVGTNSSNETVVYVPSVAQAFTLYDGFSSSTYHHLFTYVNIVNYSLSAANFVWNQNSTTNPTLSVSAGDLVNFTIVNTDNLNHTLEVNYGNSYNSTLAVKVAEVTNGNASSSGYYLFNQTGNYTYWDYYHPNTAIGRITVTGSKGTTAPAIASVMPIYSPLILNSAGKNEV